MPPPTPSPLPLPPAPPPSVGSVVALCDPLLLDGAGFVAGEGSVLARNVALVREQVRGALRGRYAYTIMEGGDPRVIVPAGGGQEQRVWKEAGFKASFLNRRIPYRGGRNGTSWIDPAEEFLRDPLRPTFMGTTFRPDMAPGAAVGNTFNTWAGWAVPPAPGDWSLLRGHVRDQVVGGNGGGEAEDAALDAWLMTWLADLFQRPNRKGGTALVLIGGEGVGKSKLVDWLREALGCAAVKITQPRQLTGNFNAALSDRLLVHAEEASWGGDRHAAGALKDLVTADVVQIERKGLEAVTRPNVARFVIVGNESWQVPTSGADARRWCVLKVNDGRKQDAGFFAQIDAQMRAGGLAGMIHDLLSWRPEDHGLTWGALRVAPDTASRRMQAAYGLSGPGARLRALIAAGEFGGRMPDGEAFRYVLNDHAETLVARSHFNAVLVGGKGEFGGTYVQASAALAEFLGPEANGGDGKRAVTFLRGDGGEFAEASTVARFVRFPPLVDVRARLARGFGDAG